jgi:hypothetical protein
MVRIEDITKMVEEDLYNFHEDGKRFKGHKLLLDFDSSDYDVELPETESIKPKYKKKKKASVFVKPKSNRRSLF